MAPPSTPKAIDLNRIVADAKSRVRANGGKEDPKYAELIDKSISEYTQKIPKTTYESILADLEPKAPAPGG